MRYTLLLFSDETLFASMTDEDRQQSLMVFGQFIKQLRQAGALVDTDWLQPGSMTTRVNIQYGEVRVQDGPFVDSRDQLGGYFVIDVPDLDAALVWAGKCPAARFGTIEVRPSGMPPGGNPYAA